MSQDDKKDSKELEFYIQTSSSRLTDEQVKDFEENGDPEFLIETVDSGLSAEEIDEIEKNHDEEEDGPLFFIQTI